MDSWITWDGLPVAAEPPYGASVVVFRRSEEGVEYLLLHRKHHGPAYEGDWAWGPPAGARLPGEPIERCAARELLEETGLELPFVETSGGSKEWAVFLAEVVGAPSIVLSDEHDRHKWVTLDVAADRSLPALVGEAFRSAARHAR